MKYVLFILLLSIIQGCTSENSKPSNCEHFRTGNFIQYDHENNITIKYTRTDSLQTEYNVSDTNKYISRVVWINSCNYDLYRIHADNPFPMLDSIRGNRPTHVSIIKTTEDYYIFTVGIDGFDRTYSDTIFMVK
jgi:hypothetical protein